jgi:hypothetical protein
MELLIAVSDFGFDVMRLSVSESVAESLGCTPVAFVAQDGMQIARLTFHRHPECRTTVVSGVGCEFPRQRVYGLREVVRLRHRSANSLHRTPAFDDRLSSLLDPCVEVFLGFQRAGEQQLRGCLEPWYQPWKLCSRVSWSSRAMLVRSLTRVQ